MLAFTIFETHLPETFGRGRLYVLFIRTKLSASDKLIGTGLSLASQHPTLWFSNTVPYELMKRVAKSALVTTSRMSGRDGALGSYMWLDRISMREICISVEFAV